MDDRFRIDLGTCRRPLVAVSGGADSLALLLLTAASHPGAVRAATVDHGLRAGATAEAAFVAGVCATRDIPHATLTLARPSADDVRRAGGVQAWAREARYTALIAEARRADCDVVLTAHHADDQAETVLMRLNRGSGVEGLAGVRAQGQWDGFPLARPLLDQRRDALRAVVDGAGLVPVDDPANADRTYARTGYRALLAARADLLDATALARSAAAAADAAEALRWSVEALAATRIGGVAPAVTLDARDLPREYRRRLLIAALDRVGTAHPRGQTVDRALAMLDAGRKAMVGATLIDPAADGIWRLAAAPPRRSH